VNGTVGPVSTPTSGLPGPPGDQPRTKAEQRRHELAHTSLRRAMHPTSPSGAIVVMGALLVAMWLLLSVDALLDHRLLRFGIKPRELDGLYGLLLTPVLHSSAAQLAADSLPLAVLGWIMLVAGGRTFVLVTAGVWLASGVVDWLAGPAHAVILGAGGVIFGWLGYILARAWFGRKVAWIATAVAVLLVFSGLLSGLLPKLHSNTFWGGQLAGFVAGALIGALLHGRRRAGRPASTPLPGNL
jgi:membrane associated rhomboid family serine protease